MSSDTIKQIGTVVNNVKAGEEFDYAVPGTMQLLKGTAGEDLNATNRSESTPLRSSKQSRASSSGVGNERSDSRQLALAPRGVGADKDPQMVERLIEHD